MRHTRSLASLTVLALSLPAYAAAFPDVPEDHWAYPAVTALTTGHKLLTPMPDGRFQGNKPFTRYQFAQTLQALIEELEAQAKTSIAGRDTGIYQFGDLARTDPKRDVLLALANRYHLYEGVPDLDPAQFGADKTVGRYEMAVVIDNLMRQAEARDVVRVTGTPKTDLPFTDIQAQHWAKPVIESVYGRYGVMVGFPDRTFRGAEELTRFQFAAAATQTIPLIRELVKQTLDAKANEKTGLAPGAIDETPWQADILVGLIPQTAVGLELKGTQAIGDWFVGERLRLLPGAAFVGQLGVTGGYSFNPAPGWRLRPSVGLDGAMVGGGVPVANLLAGYGLGLEWQPLPQWSFGLEAEGRHNLFASQAIGGSLGTPFLPGGQIKAAYHPVSGLALQLGFAAWGIPGTTQTAVVAGPSLGLRWRF